MKAINGTAIVYTIAMLLLLIVARPLLLDGLAEESIRWAVRRTIDLAFVLFFLSFGAAALVQLASNDTTRWLRRNRRYVGIGFGMAFLGHAALLILLWQVYPEPFLSDLTAEVLYTGIVAFTLGACMLLTSNDAAVAALGAGWGHLHTVSAYIILALFFLTYVTSLHDPFFWPFFAATVLLFAMRLFARRQRGRQDVRAR